VASAAVAVPAAAHGPGTAGGPARAGGRARAAVMALALAASVAVGLAGVAVPVAPARAAGAVPHRPDPPVLAGPPAAAFDEPPAAAFDEPPAVAFAEPAAVDAEADIGAVPVAGADATTTTVVGPGPRARAKAGAKTSAKADAKAGAKTGPKAGTRNGAEADAAAKAKQGAKAKPARRVLHMRYSVPVRIRIPSIRVNAPLMKLGLDRRGRLQTPPLSKPGVAGWYVGSASPGQIGPAVVVGHMDTRTGPAVFFRLRRLKPGARIYIDRRDGSTAVFEARKRIRVPKTRFPTDAVYGDIGNAGLRLITCGGAFDHRTRHYRDNIIVFARLVRAINHRSA